MDGRTGGRAFALAAWILAASLAPVQAHGDLHAAPGAALDRDGAALMMGDLRLSQPGPLLVVPATDGPLRCDAPSVRVGLARGAAFGLSANATHVGAYFDVAPRGLVAVALDTHEATRALLLMEEHVVALHDLAGSVFDGAARSSKTGVLGLPYPVPGGAAHDMRGAVEGGGVQLAWDGSGSGGSCWTAPGHLGFLLPRAANPALAPGRIVHVVALHDEELPHFLLRPIDDSTSLVQVNAYLARPGEDPGVLRRTFEPEAGLREAAPLALVLLGTFWAAAPAMPRRTAKRRGR